MTEFDIHNYMKQMFHAFLPTVVQNVDTPEKREFLLLSYLGNLYDKTTVAVLMAQAKHETDQFRTMKEYGSDSYFSKYDFREDLGNNKKGMGAKYKGRGFIQLTGYHNYTKAGEALGIDLINHPELAEEPVTALRIFDWFIFDGNKYRDGSNVYDHASQGNVTKATKLINGGKTALEERTRYFHEYMEKLK